MSALNWRTRTPSKAFNDHSCWWSVPWAALVKVGLVSKSRPKTILPAWRSNFLYRYLFERKIGLWRNENLARTFLPRNVDLAPRILWSDRLCKSHCNSDAGCGLPFLRKEQFVPPALPIGAIIKCLRAMEKQMQNSSQLHERYCWMVVLASYNES